MKLSLIIAMSQNKVIGSNGKLPWHFSSDLKYFKQTTRNKTVIMGRKTFESSDMPKPLPNRRNLILSRSENFTFPKVEIVKNIDEALDLCKNDSEAFIIGGSEIIKQTFDRIDRLYLTIILKDFDGDVYFPVDIDWNQFNIVSKTIVEEDNTILEFIIADRKIESPINTKELEIYNRIR